MRLRPLLIALALLAASAQAAAEPDASTPPHASTPNDISPAEVAACVSHGGFVMRAGFAAALMCVMPYADAGRPCQDNDDCDGACMAAEDEQSHRTIGRCQADTNHFGCHAFFNHGRVEGAICVD